MLKGVGSRTVQEIVQEVAHLLFDKVLVALVQSLTISPFAQIRRRKTSSVCYQIGIVDGRLEHRTISCMKKSKGMRGGGKNAMPWRKAYPGRIGYR